ncbi:MAG: carbohydrate kinase [Ruminococcaceae bacterium]|nr:carbohydrate kinase [Oscillospiraceae bacterium]
MKQFDLVALGEILIDFTFTGHSDSGMRLFEQNPGGAPANVLAAVARLGGRAAFIGKIGKDLHGAFLRETLEKHHIDTTALKDTDKAFTTLAFVQLSESGERSFSFARKPGADTTLWPEEIDYGLIEHAKIFHVGSLSMTDEPAKSATLAALSFAKEKGILISYDPNYRPALWPDEETAIREMRSLLPYADVVKLSDEEITLLTDKSEPASAAETLINRGTSCVIVTLGAEGALVTTQKDQYLAPAKKMPVVDTTGAGDAFMGGFLYCLSRQSENPAGLCGETLRSFADFANATAGLCVGKRGGITAMPTLEEVHGLVNLQL